jgi:fused signal recognition particle receptor
MFSFFKKKPPAELPRMALDLVPAAQEPKAEPAPAAAPPGQPVPAAAAPALPTPAEPSPAMPAPAAPVPAMPVPAAPTVATGSMASGPAAAADAAPATLLRPHPTPTTASGAAGAPAVAQAAPAAPALVVVPDAPAAPRSGWVDRLRAGLRKTGTSITSVFVTAKIDDALYEELEAALLMADAGVKATQFLLDDLKQRVKAARATDPAAVRLLLVDAIAQLLAPLEKALVVGEHTPTVMMVVGVNGAGKTTSIGKLTRHLAQADQRVLLAAADTFRAAAREQLAVWAGRNNVEIVSQEGADPAAVTFDAVVAGRARGHDVVIADTAGRLPTQLHLMEELKKIRRTIAKAMEGAPHEVLLVVDGNTGQNALAQVRAFDDALQLTGLVVTKLDGTAKGGVLAALARERPVPVYFIGVGEKLEDLETFSAREFAQALLS